MMPTLSKSGKNLVLSIQDNPALASDLDTKMFFVSILEYTFDSKNSLYFFTNTDDIVNTARVIQETVNFFSRNYSGCKLDSACSTILEDIRNSEREFQTASEHGSAIKQSKAVTIALPSEFKRTLKDYQKKPVKHVLEVNNGANFSVPGSGKTTTTYAAFSVWKNSNVVEKILVIGPRSSFMSWEDEFKECFGREAKSLRLNGDLMKDLLQNTKNREILLCTYQLLSNYTDEVIELMGKYKFLLVLDESHNIKNIAGGLWSASVLKIAPYAKRRLILTGTPMPQSAMDLWTQFTFLWPYRNLMGEASSYKRYVQTHDGLGNYVARIDPFYTRIKKNDLGLTEPAVERKLVPLNRYQQIIYDAIAAKTLEEIDSLEERQKLQPWRKRNKIIRLLQAASNPSLLAEHSKEFEVPPLSGEGLPISHLIDNYTKYEIPSKLVEAAKIAREIINSGNKVIIWTTFIHNIETLEKELLSDLKPLTIYGDVPKDANEEKDDNREERIKKFKNDPGHKLLIANPSSLAESVSLHKNAKGETVCKHAIYVDRTYNAGQFMQSMDRIHRIGLDAGTKIKYTILMGEGTIDEDINDRLNQKIQYMFDSLNDDFLPIDLENSVSDISDAQLDRDFESAYEYLKKRKSESNDNQHQGN